VRTVSGVGVVISTKTQSRRKCKIKDERKKRKKIKSLKPNKELQDRTNQRKEEIEKTRMPLEIRL